MVALIFCGDLRYCPYIKRYIERLEIKEIDYEVFFWNRGAFKLDLPQNYHYYDSPSDLKKSKISKLFDFVNFRRWLKNRFREKQPDKLILLSTLSGVLIFDYVFLHKAKYVYDIRDYSYEHVKPFYWIEKKIIDNSSFTAISSRGFCAFLPEHDYVIAHNFNRDDIREDVCFKKREGRIRFVWNGVVRYFEFQKQYLDALKNDSRFEIVFHGDGPDLELYKNYCQKEHFTNVLFTGAYNNSSKAELLRDADILNNCYGYTMGAGNKLKYAVSNRFYDGMIYHIPQLVENDGYKTKLVNKYDLGWALMVDNHFADALWEEYNSIDCEVFDDNCRYALSKVLDDDDQFIHRIDTFISGL